jgi:energy-coupling factor transporter ATP-binding protein EcfA2
MRAVLRNPELLILDEATANIDTVTEQALQNILNKLPSTTTRVIIAHRLNTIANADEIFFVNAGEIIPAAPWSKPSTCSCTESERAEFTFNHQSLHNWHVIRGTLTEFRTPRRISSTSFEFKFKHSLPHCHENHALE